MIFIGRSTSVNRKIVSSFLVILISLILIVFTNISLIFFKLPAIFHSNEIGSIILSSYFSFPVGLLFQLIIQGFFLKFSLVNSYVSYRLVVSILIFLTVNLCKLFTKNRYVQLIIAGILMSIIIKPAGLFIWKILGNNIDLAQASNMKSFITETIKYMGSALMAVVFFGFLKKSEKILKIGDV